MSFDPDWFEGAMAPRRMLAWRGVEAQHVVSTMRLVDTPAEQDLLEQLLEGSKPPMPTTARPRHYLLTTPFRYSPAHASRFRKPHAKGQWYGAEVLFAACAEVAYWRHRFILDSTGLLDQMLLTEHTFFQAEVNGTAIDLTTEPWRCSRVVWAHGSADRRTRPLAAAAQEQGVQWLCYESVRAPGHRCAAVFDPDSLSEPTPSLEQTMQTWRCKATRASVMFSSGRESYVWDF